MKAKGLIPKTPLKAGLSFCLVLSIVLQAMAAELKVEAKLIWGTNDEKSPNPAHTPVDQTTAERLRKVFKWKNYFVVNRQTKAVPSRGSTRFELSKKCTVEVTELEGPKVEVKLIGDGKEVHRTVKSLAKGEWFAYAGEDKGENAWFVIIHDLDEKQ